MLVGDSAAMVVYGHDSTIPVTVGRLIPLVAAVVRRSRRAMVVADLPFGSYQQSPSGPYRHPLHERAGARGEAGGRRTGAPAWNSHQRGLFRSWPTWA